MDDTRGTEDSQREDHSNRISYDDHFNSNSEKPVFAMPVGLDQDESGKYLPNLPAATTPFVPSLPKLSDLSLPNDFTIDPMMRQAYSLPPAGTPTRRLLPELNSSIRHTKYNMASDIFGTGMDKSWVNEQQNAPTDHMHAAPKPKEPGSFKITQIASNNPNPEASGGFGISGSSAQAPNRRARESAGNPLTGTGYDDSGNKTAKRYFEGSNANQKLW
ncbi:unnamed protein product [Orchesella dallaii]|uniref:Uncharacterized protein n=1 Tax=Orchesella dallaii TaxID=48710 RepID=A0ABP1QE99_9HEXA